MAIYKKVVLLATIFYMVTVLGRTEEGSRKEIVSGPEAVKVVVSEDVYKQKVASPINILRAAHGYHGGYNEYVWERMYARQGKQHTMNYSHPAFYEPKLYGLRSYYKPVTRPRYIYYGSLKNGVCGARHDGCDS